LLGNIGSLPRPDVDLHGAGQEIEAADQDSSERLAFTKRLSDKHFRESIHQYDPLAPVLGARSAGFVGSYQRTIDQSLIATSFLTQ
jgi:hypothetical protein